MSIAKMTDRMLPLAERAEAFALRIPPLPGWDQGYTEWRINLAALLADIAAADRLARADSAYWDWVGGDPGEWAIGEEHAAAFDAYRARMAQGVRHA